MVSQAVQAEAPYAMAFVDVRMPPGWDGVQTIKKMWEVDPDLQVEICTAFADYSWDEMIEELGESDRLLILKKPFDLVALVAAVDSAVDGPAPIPDPSRAPGLPFGAGAGPE